jgi:hypothetical protein
MANSEKKKELEDIAKEMLPDPIIVIGYLEHQLDLTAQLIVDLADSITLTPEAQERLDKLKSLLQHSSINFLDMESPLEAYKIPNAVALKQQTRKVQEKYLKAQIREGVFG